ncbi:MAG: acyl-CoA/acyl-ACP dehydrogenase [Candidatus Thermoplasmatota archaeon]|jgi:alkylation response protein AidB-like acyl-CoA dehydrogenase|nr:acyl-CoA/acyl-ACP dehydrogenase [Candidatus Thermoplasmatota archaeon]MCL5794038.1 acyl-CoA/acyl-ACP dehydrogenase [Candidatus Thermoplasmatota archaeon]
MDQDSYRMLRENVDEFCARNVEPVSLKMEREGMASDLAKKSGTQGFNAAIAAQSNGGSALDRESYLTILERAARSSPSFAMFLLMQNSIAGRILEAAGKTGEIGEIASGAKTATVEFLSLNESSSAEYSINVSNGKATGKLRNVIFPSADLIVFLHQDSLYLARGSDGTEPLPVLGFRGLGLGDVVFRDRPVEKLSENGGAKLIMDALKNAGREVSAVALGITGRSVDMAVEYSRVRKTFGRPLKDYEPVAFQLAGFKAQEEELRSMIFFSSVQDGYIKPLATDLARRATKIALQVHGGYGYLEDFGVEKFYRDSMTLSIYFGPSRSDMRNLSREVYGEESGVI